MNETHDDLPADVNNQQQSSQSPPQQSVSTTYVAMYILLAMLPSCYFCVL